MISVVSTCVCHVVKDVRPGQTKALGYGKQALRSERALRVDVQTLALGATLIDGQLARDCQHVAQLCLPSSELACRSEGHTPLYSTQRTKHLRN